MFTKDISFEDCLLDLVDNSIDGLIRTSELGLSNISNSIFSDEDSSESKSNHWRVDISYSEDKVCIRDNCGGIDLKYAMEEAFNFGHGIDWNKGFLGVYGVGLKRALFKIGNQFSIKSKTRKNGFSCSLLVDDWVKKDDSFDDWRLPIIKEGKAKSIEEEGTIIEITRIHPEVKMRMAEGTIENILVDAISRTYTFFLGKYVNISLNGVSVNPMHIPIARPESGTGSYEEFDINGVNVKIFATLAEANEDGEYEHDNAGWYVICNGRAVLSADKSKVSGWGTHAMPTFQPKHRGFIGFVFFESEDPMMLPWTTTKRGLNKESAVYLRVRNKMITGARPVLSFINKWYPSRNIVSSERETAKQALPSSFQDIKSSGNVSFQASAPPKPVRTTMKVQYHAKISDIDKINKHVRKNLSGGRVGKLTFDYFLKNEGLS